MLGKDIAKNLRENASKWRKTFLVDNSGPEATYCVLGLKAHEAGIPDKVLIFADELQEYWRNIQDAYEVARMNDTSQTLQELIDRFDAQGDVDFKGIEIFIEYCRNIMVAHPELAE